MNNIFAWSCILSILRYLMLFFIHPSAMSLWNMVVYTWLFLSHPTGCYRAFHSPTHPSFPILTSFIFYTPFWMSPENKQLRLVPQIHTVIVICSLVFQSIKHHIKDLKYLYLSTLIFPSWSRLLIYTFRATVLWLAPFFGNPSRYSPILYCL